MDLEARLSNVGATSIFTLANPCDTTAGHLEPRQDDSQILIDARGSRPVISDVAPI